MAIFSNLEGTMKTSFVLGKGGAKLSYENAGLSIYNYNGTSYLPLSAGTPVNPNDLVTLQYLNTHGSGSEYAHLSGTTDPDNSIGTNGDMYFKVNSTNVVQIFFKDDSMWKPLNATSDDSYVTKIQATPSEFVLTGSTYVYTLSAATHGRGANIIVQLQGSTTGSVFDADIVVDNSGNITVTTSTQPQETVNVIIIGQTFSLTPYSELIDKIDWVLSGSDYVLTISQPTHGQVPGAIFVSVFQNTVDAATSTSPYKLVTVQTTIDSSGNVTLTSNIQFSGKVVISGK